MFKSASAKTLLVLVFSLSLFESLSEAAPSRIKRNLKSYASVEYIIDDQNIMAVSDVGDWNVGEILPVISQNAKIGVFAYSELVWVKPRPGNRFELKLKLLRQSRRYMIQQGDYIKRLNLETENTDYVGTTDLLVKRNESAISSKYKPLVYQGIFIGETAQTLYQGEMLTNFLGNAYYGLTEDFMVGSFLTADVLTGLNGSFKFKAYDSESAAFSTGISYVEIRNALKPKTPGIENQPDEYQREQTLNLNIFWDTVSSDSLISHTFLSLGLIKWQESGEAATIKALTSSFQTGYEIILNNWDRVSVGPSYNFDSKTIGGYIFYLFIFDQFHIELSVNTTNVTEFKWNPKDGYYGNFDLYWRF